MNDTSLTLNETYELQPESVKNDPENVPISIYSRMPSYIQSYQVHYTWTRRNARLKGQKVPWSNRRCVFYIYIRISISYRITCFLYLLNIKRETSFFVLVTHARARVCIFDVHRKPRQRKFPKKRPGNVLGTPSVDILRGASWRPAPSGKMSAHNPKFVGTYKKHVIYIVLQLLHDTSRTEDNDYNKIIVSCLPRDRVYRDRMYR